MSRFSLPQNRIIEQSRDEAGFTEILQSRSVQDFTPRFFDKQGQPSVVPPESGGFLDTFGLRISRGGQQSKGPWAFFTQSFGQSISDIYRSTSDVAFPSAVVDDMVMTEEGPVPLSEADVGTLYESADPFTKSLLAERGVDKERLIHLTGNDPEELDKAYREIVHFTRTNQALNKYAEDHEFLYGLAGLTAGVTDLVDPLLIATLGTGSAVSSVAKVAGKSISRAGLKATAARGAEKFAVGLRQGSVFEASARAVAPVRNTTAANVLIAGSGAAEGLAFSYASQLANHEGSLRLGLIEEDTGFTPDYFGLGVGTLMGTAFASMSAMSVGAPPVRMSAREIIQTAPDTFASNVLEDRMVRGVIDPDELLDPLDVIELEDLDNASRIMFNSQLYRDSDQQMVRDYINEIPDEDLSDLSEFMTKIPNPDEFRAWRDNPNRSRSDTTAISRLQDGKLELLHDRAEAIIRGDEAAVKSFNKKLERLESDYREAIRPLTERPGETDEELLRLSRQAPITSIASPRQDRMNRMDFLMRDMEKKYTSLNTLSSYAHRAMGLFGDLMSPTRNVRRAARKGADPMDTVLGAWASFVVPDTTAWGFRGRRGGVRTLKQAYGRVGVLKDRARSIKDGAMREYYGRKRFTEADEKEFGRMVFEYNSGHISNESVHPAVRKAADEIKGYFRDMGVRGVRSGYLTALQDNYLPFNLIPNSDEFSLTQLSDMWSDWMYEKWFDPNLPNAALHLETVRKISNQEYDDLLDSLGVDRSAPPPKLTLSDLPEELMEEYLARLRGTLRQDAEASIARKQGQDRMFVEDPLKDPDDDPVTFFVDNRGQRKMEQDFWMQPKVLDLGVVETNLDEVLQFYDRSTGYNIARQEAMQDLFGEFARWDDAMTWLHNQKMTPEQKDILTELENLELTNAGRVKPKGRHFTARVLKGLGRATVNFRVPLSIAPTEGVGSLVTGLFSASDLKSAARQAIGVFRRMDQASLREQGFGFHVDRNHHRIFGDTRDRQLGEHEGGLKGMLGKGVLFLEDTSRLLGEYQATSYALTNRFHTAYSFFYHRRDKIDRLRGIDTDLEYNSKEFRASVREAGLRDRVDTARDLAEAGLLDDEMLDMAQLFRETNEDALADIKEAWKIVADLDGDQKFLAEEFVERLRDYATKYAETFVTTSDASTMFRPDNDWLQLFTQFMSFPMAWYGKTFRRASEMPAYRNLGYLGLYAAGEMFASILRDIAYNGHSPESVLERWEENPHSEMLKVVERVPFFGPWNQVNNAILSPFQEDPYPAQTPGAASLSFLLRGATGMKAAAEDIRNGDPIRPSAERAGENLIPGLNFWGYRLMEGIVTQPDEDRP